ncbi:hypothetical protein WAI453_006072 [Rhynchosporium graminicola]
MAASSHHDDGDLETDATDHPAVPTRILKKKPSGVEIGSIRRKKAAERVVVLKSSIRSSPYSMVQDHLFDAALASDVLDIQQDPSVVEPMNDSVTSGNPYSMRAQHYHAMYAHAEKLEDLKGDEPAEGEACLEITALIQGFRRAEAFLKGPYKESFDVKALGGAMVDFNVLRQTHRKDGQLESLSAYAGKMFMRVCEENQFMERTREGLEIIPEGQELVVGDSTTSSLSGMLPIRSTSSMSGILPPPARNAESGGKFPSPPPT